MPASKIQDEQEVIRWFAEGKTYEWMTAEYLRKYHLQVSPSLWGNFRRRRDLPRRIVRDDQLIPWAVSERHRWNFYLQMLRLEARQRAGEAVRAADAVRHRNFIARLREEGLVVDYDADSAEGFTLVKRRPTDADIIRQPKVSARTSRHAAD